MTFRWNTRFCIPILTSLTPSDTVFLTLDTDDGPQWALYDKESVIRLLMEDEEGQAVLRSALESKGVTFIPYEGSASDKQMQAIIANLKDKEEETTHG